MGRDRLRLELLQDEIFLLFGARSAVDGFTRAMVPGSQVVTTLSSAS